MLDSIKDIQFAMLTTLDKDNQLHSRPMAYKQVDKDGELWFFTRADSHKVDEIKKNSLVNVAFSDPSKQNYVSVCGRAELIRDKQKAKELWNDYLKAWFPGGLDDPDLALLRIDIDSAEYWDSASNIMTRAVGYVKAALGDGSKLEGENKKVNFP
ncbi:unnamed protein product [Didymodactylos carnosus]|uniref:General stress protein FMN-binding split barrel domain-containing protein n=1 Tax=Didymodactylos carnosus TaxID=1234261 RepID=A0A814Q5B8_9BILA|nr:unnamed protein product [Didymodactylos carnosus]CAF1128249.1 unnamed protein product [Didymodactylos carnosus]CAF3878894.1 unnamed protein product [Didymodactylos carnosus]CAF3908728.1 unnamed protein product [Didymodactylos carnosus]